MADKVFFIKYGVNRPLRDSRQVQFPFTDIGDDTGLLELDNALHTRWVKELGAISGKFGVVKVSEAEVAEAKKKASANHFRLNSLRGQPQAPLRLETSVLPKAPAAVVADPIQIPASIPPPRKRRSALPTESLAPTAMSANSDV